MPMTRPRLPCIKPCIVSALSLSSCPGLTRLRGRSRFGGAKARASRPGLVEFQDVDGRDEPGHDGKSDCRLRDEAYASSRLNTSVALVPPKPKEFDSTVPSLALSMRLRTIGMSAKTGSSSVMWALSQMKPLFIISRQ